MKPQEGVEHMNQDELTKIMLRLVENRSNPPVIVKEAGGLDCEIEKLLQARGHITKKKLAHTLDAWKSANS
jgi:hypothetical protein